MTVVMLNGQRLQIMVEVGAELTLFANQYLLLAEREICTTSYGPSFFFPSFYEYKEGKK